MKKVFSYIRGYIKNTDKILLAFCLIASVYGTYMVYFCTNYFFGTFSYTKVQIIATGLGLACAVIVSLVDYRTWAKLWKIHMPLTVILVILTFFIGLKREGADDRAWLALPFGGMTLQPSELLKLSFILTFGLHLEKVREHLNDIVNLLLLCLHGGIPVLLIVLQGDDGTALVFIMIFLCMLFAAGLSWKYLLSALAVMPFAIFILWNHVLSPDQKARIELVFHPDLYPLTIGLQPKQGKISLGSGMLFGRGFDGPLRKVPAIQNDYILAFIGETLGFVGCIAVIAILLSICMRILKISGRSEDYLGKFICVGVFAMLSTQAVINMGMVIGVLPVIGITLPFFSAGGTSIVTLYIGIGMVLSVFVHNKKRMFE